MQILSKEITKKKERPVKVVQFGEGNFLRGFVDYMIDIANEQGKFDGDIVIVKPIEFGDMEMLCRQGCQYTVSLRGIADGKAQIVNRVVTSVTDAVCAYGEYDKYMDLARIDTLRFVVSNTTEAGIVFDSSDRFEMTPPQSFPGKLTQFLYRRFQAFSGDKDKGLVMLPVELIDDNGIMLKKCVMRLIDLWGLKEEFRIWVEEACVFTSTLVDRIVTGYPKDNEGEEWEKLGYQDHILVTGEPFALWVIENPLGDAAPIDVGREFPLPEAGLPVIFTDDQKPYKQRKVRILNGAHTSFALTSYLAGNDYVKESMEDEDIREFMAGTIFDEVIPSLILPIKGKGPGKGPYREELEGFAREVINRFHNPYVKHSLLSISLNCVSKWCARCLPSLLAYVGETGGLPSRLVFSLAALMAFYNGTEIRGKAMIAHREGKEFQVLDDMPVLTFFAAQNNRIRRESLPKVQGGNEDYGKEVEGFVKEFVKAFLGQVDFWGQDLNQVTGLTERVTAYFMDIKSNGMRAALCKNF